MSWVLFIILALAGFMWLGKREHDKQQNKIKNAKPFKKKKNKNIYTPPTQPGKPTTGSFTGLKKKDETIIFKDSKELIQKIKKEFEISSQKTSMIKFKIKLDLAELSSFIKEDIENYKYFNDKKPILDFKYYNRCTEDIEDYIYDVEIDTIEDFINNKNFKNHDTLNMYYGFGCDIEEVYGDIINNNNSDEYIEFEVGLNKVLSSNGLVDTRTPADNEIKIYIDRHYNVNKLKEILSKNNLKASGTKTVLIDRVIENNLIKIPNVVIYKKDKIKILIKEFAKAYCEELLEQIKPLNTKVQKILKNNALIENPEIKECK